MLKGEYDHFHSIEASMKSRLSFFFLSFIYLLTYLFLHWVFIAAYRFSSCEEQGYLFIAVPGVLTVVVSIIVHHRLQSSGSALVVQGLSCPVSYEVFPGQGSNSCLLYWQEDSDHQESPWLFFKLTKTKIRILFSFLLSFLPLIFLYLKKLSIASSCPLKWVVLSIYNFFSFIYFNKNFFHHIFSLFQL